MSVKNITMDVTINVILSPKWVIQGYSTYNVSYSPTLEIKPSLECIERGGFDAPLKNEEKIYDEVEAWIVDQLEQCEDLPQDLHLSYCDGHIAKVDATEE
jgi:hypothetical protein